MKTILSVIADYKTDNTQFILTNKPITKHIINRLLT